MALPSISVVAHANGNEAEGSPAIFRFERTGDTSAALSVGYQLFGTAKAGSDYTGSSTGTISFEAGSATASLSLPALADGALIDPGETIIARVNPSETYTISPGKQFATATITAEGMVLQPNRQTHPKGSHWERKNKGAFAALRRDGSVVAWGDSNFGGTAPAGLSGVTQIYSTESAFAALKSDGTVIAWGDSSNGGTAPAGLSGVTQISSSATTFAALKSDGTVVKWGSLGWNATGLRGVTKIFSTPYAFAALKSDGSVEAWGNSYYGGEAPVGLSGVTQITSNGWAFAALKSDGTVVAWGSSVNGGTASPPAGLSGVIEIFSTEAAFAALKSDGTVIAWGDSSNGGTAPGGLGGVTQIFSTQSAFAALKGDGTVVTWGSGWGGTAPPAGLSNVTQICSNGTHFAALKSDGTVVTWGEFNIEQMPAGLSGVTQIFANNVAFAALKSDGTVAAWGDSSWGGKAPAGLSGVTQIFATDSAFTALKSDGTVVSWGNTAKGGTAPAGLSNVVGFANPNSDDRLITDTIAPTVTALSVNGSTITLTLSEALSSVVPATSRFFVLVGGVARTVSSAAVNISNNTVSLTLGSAVTAGQAVTLAYSDATSGNETTGIIEDVPGNDLASFSARTVTNSTVAPTYVITPSSISINEGLTLATTATTTNVAAGITLYWSASGTGINAADFSAGALTGSGIVGTDGKFSFSHALASDLTTEGDESLQIKLFSDAARTVQLGSTATLTVADISISIPTYRISTPSGREKNEGSTITTTVDTTNVTAGTTLYYSLSGTDITSVDLSTGTINGFGEVGINGTFTFSHGIANDNITEGNETLEIKLFTDAERSQQVGTSSGIIWDTSTTLKPSEAPFNSLIKLDDTSCPSDLKATREGALYSTAGASMSLNGFSNRKVDALVQKQNKAGQTVWKEYLGGNENDFPRALSIGVDDAIYVASDVSSTGNAMGGVHIPLGWQAILRWRQGLALRRQCRQCKHRQFPLS
jgi:uncharacterized repeat protein (TIGR02059 family)